MYHFKPRLDPSICAGAQDRAKRDSKLAVRGFFQWPLRCRIRPNCTCFRQGGVGADVLVARSQSELGPTRARRSHRPGDDKLQASSQVPEGQRAVLQAGVCRGSGGAHRSLTTCPPRRGRAGAAATRRPSSGRGGGGADVLVARSQSELGPSRAAAHTDQVTINTQTRPHLRYPRGNEQCFRQECAGALEARTGR